jgi:hypothetical protein
MGKGFVIGLTVIGNDMTPTLHPPLVDDQTLQAYRTTGVDFVGADTHFGPETETKSIGKTAAAIQKNIGRINQVHESDRPLIIIGNDHIGVAGTISIDMIDSGCHIG